MYRRQVFQSGNAEQSLLILGIKLELCEEMLKIKKLKCMKSQVTDSERLEVAQNWHGYVGSDLELLAQEARWSGHGTKQVWT